jgi:hypothetical protein
MLLLQTPAIALFIATVFLPNVWPLPPSCDAKAPLALSDDRRAALSKAPARAGLTEDDRWVALASSAPGGFAGAYVEPSAKPATAPSARGARRLVIRLARTAEQDAALRAIVPKLREISGKDIDRGGVVVAPARWDFAQLVEWRRFLEPHAHAVAKILSTDIDATQNRISYGVPSRSDRSALLEHLGTLHIPCGLVAVTVR